MYKINHADIKQWAKDYDGEPFDAILCDPPYELGFMGKSWDSTGIAYDKDMWANLFKLVKPGGHLLAFSGSRTYHRMAVAIEDAGFEIRDMIEWVYGSGFPKSLNIGKAVDKLGGQSLSWFIDYILKVADEKGISRKELTMLFPSKNGNPTGWLWNKQKTQGITLEQYHKIKEFLQLPFADISECEREIIGRGKAGLTAGTIANFAGEKEFDLTKGTSEWEGWGTALKPAHEPICMARKPLAEKTVANNVLKHGTGGLNIDGTRIEGTDEVPTFTRDLSQAHGNKFGAGTKVPTKSNGFTGMGRFPANLIHDGSDEVEAVFPDTVPTSYATSKTVKGGMFGMPGHGTERIQDTTRSASRFFYCAKAGKSERNAGLEGFANNNPPYESHRANYANTKGIDNPRAGAGRGGGDNRNNHPTVKPLSLTKYLATLIKPPQGGRLLVPFSGSGSEMIGALQAGWEYVEGVELTEEYIPIAEARIKHWLEQMEEDDKQIKLI